MNAIFRFLFICVFVSIAGCDDKPDITIDSDRQLSVYPNPAIYDAYVIVENDQPSVLEVFDTNGKTILNESVSPGRVEYRIALNDRPSGTYHVSWKSGSKVITKKIVKYQP